MNVLLYRRLIELGYLRHQWTSPLMDSVAWDSAEQQCIATAAQAIALQGISSASSHSFVDRSVAASDLACMADDIPLDMEDSTLKGDSPLSMQTDLQELAANVLEVQNASEEEVNEDAEGTLVGSPPSTRMVLAIEASTVIRILSQDTYLLC